MIEPVVRFVERGVLIRLVAGKSDLHILVGCGVICWASATAGLAEYCGR